MYPMSVGSALLPSFIVGSFGGYMMGFFGGQLASSYCECVHHTQGTADKITFVVTIIGMVTGGALAFTLALKSLTQK